MVNYIVAYFIIGIVFTIIIKVLEWLDKAKVEVSNNESGKKYNKVLSTILLVILWPYWAAMLCYMYYWIYQGRRD